MSSLFATLPRGVAGRTVYALNLALPLACLAAFALTRTPPLPTATLALVGGVLTAAGLLHGPVLAGFEARAEAAGHPGPLGFLPPSAGGRFNVVLLFSILAAVLWPVSGWALPTLVPAGRAALAGLLALAVALKSGLAMAATDIEVDRLRRGVEQRPSVLSPRAPRGGLPALAGPESRTADILPFRPRVPPPGR